MGLGLDVGQNKVARENKMDRGRDVKIYRLG